jgi:hypothetical protein
LVVEILPHGHHDIVGEKAGCLLLCQLDKVFNLKQNQQSAIVLLTVLPTFGRTFLPVFPEKYSRAKRKGFALINFYCFGAIWLWLCVKNVIIFIIFLPSVSIQNWSPLRSFL